MKFRHFATCAVAAIALAGYSIGLTGYAAIKILSPAFYALDDAKTPMTIAIISIGVNFVGSYFLREWLSNYGVTPATPHGYGHVGVALAMTRVPGVAVRCLRCPCHSRRRPHCDSRP